MSTEPVIAHRDADGDVTLEWADGQREALVSRELMEQMVHELNTARALEEERDKLSENLDMLIETYNAIVPERDTLRAERDRLRHFVEVIAEQAKDPAPDLHVWMTSVRAALAALHPNDTPEEK